MKKEELMVGDWVVRRGVPEEPMCVCDIKASAGVAYLDQDGRGVTEKFENIGPITLTEEILKKNGFEKHSINISGIKWSCYDLGYNMYLIYENGAYTLGRLHFDYLNTENTLISFALINYVHELQHLMNDGICDKKDIVL